MTEVQREIRRKKRVLEYAVKHGNVRMTCRRFGIARSTFYLWRDRYREHGESGLARRMRRDHNYPNKTPDAVIEKILHLRRTYPPFPLGDKIRHVEVRLLEDAVGDRCFALFDAIGGGELAGIVGNWADPADPYRVRIKRQEILGVDYIVFQAEPASGFDDPNDRNPEPDTSTSHKVLVSSLSLQDATAVPEPNEFGFGNRSTPSGDFGSTWRSVHVTGTDLTTEPLPYWPPQPPAPTLTLTTATPPHEVDSQVDLPLGAYLVNDAATLVLDTLSGTLTGAPIPDPSAPPAQHIETFTGLGGNQTVTGWVEVADVSWRTSTGPVSVLVLAVVPMGTRWFPLLLATALLFAGQRMYRRTARS